MWWVIHRVVRAKHTPSDTKQTKQRENTHTRACSRVLQQKYLNVRIRTVISREFHSNSSITTKDCFLKESFTQIIIIPLTLLKPVGLSSNNAGTKQHWTFIVWTKNTQNILFCVWLMLQFMETGLSREVLENHLEFEQLDLNSSFCHCFWFDGLRMDLLRYTN